jgi:hypothetical protein
VDPIKSMLYTIQRFQILSLVSSSSAQKTVSDSYAYAWSESVYPLLNDSAAWHQAFEECFAVRRELLAELHAFLSERWDQRKPLSFYELEDHYGIRGPRRPGPDWDQARLVRACRYFYLHQQFDSEFWSGLLDGGQHPAEAEVISRKFDADSIYFE